MYRHPSRTRRERLSGFFSRALSGLLVKANPNISKQMAKECVCVCVCTSDSQFLNSKVTLANTVTSHVEGLCLVYEFSFSRSTAGVQRGRKKHEKHTHGDPESFNFSDEERQRRNVRSASFTTL